MAKESLQEILKTQNLKVHKFGNTIDPTIKKYKNDLNTIAPIIEKIEESWSGSWLGFHSNLYYQGFEKPKWNESFNTEWGSIYGIPATWKEKDFDEISAFVDSKIGKKNVLTTIQKFLDRQVEQAKAFQSSICTELSSIRSSKDYDKEIEILDKIEDIRWGVDPVDFVQYRMPKQFMTRDSRALFQGIKTPPHITYQAKCLSCLSIISDIETFINSSQRLLRQIEIKQSSSATGIGVSDGISNVLRICKRFHLVARQIRNRHNNRPTLEIEDEYDVQDLLHSLLKIYFDDVRPEEWTPSYAGGSSKIDFLLKKEKIVIEAKKTRKNLTDKKIGEQLLIDIAKYKNHPDCRTLICIIYDPEGRIGNPKGLSNDLTQMSDDSLKIIAIVEPSS